MLLCQYTISLYATAESPTEDNAESPDTTEDNAESPDTTDESAPNQPDNTSLEPQDGEEPCPEGQVSNPQTGVCESTLPEPCPEGQVSNPQTGVCNPHYLNLVQGKKKQGG